MVFNILSNQKLLGLKEPMQPIAFRNKSQFVTTPISTMLGITQLLHIVAVCYLPNQHKSSGHFIHCLSFFSKTACRLTDVKFMVQSQIIFCYFLYNGGTSLGQLPPRKNNKKNANLERRENQENHTGKHTCEYTHIPVK